MAILIVACFVSVLLLSSQSRASYPTYLLAATMLIALPRWIDIFKVRLTWWFVALLVWLSASAFWSEPYIAREAISIWIRALLVFAFVVAFAECKMRGQVQRWMSVGLVVAGLGVVVAAIANFYLTNPVDGRLNGLGQLDTHVIAALVHGVVGIFALQTLLGERSRWLRGIALLCLILVVYSVYLSDSRNAWVSVLVGFVTLILSMRTDDARQFSVSILVLVGVGTLVLGVLLASDEARDVILPRGLSFRPEIWRGAWDLITADSLLLGRGISTPSLVEINTMRFDHAHNMYLSVIQQGGMIALLLYMVVLWKGIAALLANFEQADAKLGLSILVLGLTAHLLDGHELIDKVGSSWFLIWLPIGIALGLRWQSVERPRT